MGFDFQDLSGRRMVTERQRENEKEGGVLTVIYMHSQASTDMAVLPVEFQNVMAYAML